MADATASAACREAAAPTSDALLRLQRNSSRRLRQANSRGSDSAACGGGGTTSGGGTLQLWRMLDLIYSPLDAVVAELEANREAIVGRRPAAAAGPDTAMKDAE